MKVRVMPGQCISDIAMMTCGQLDDVALIAAHNGLSVTDDLEVDTLLDIPTGLSINNRVLTALRDYNQVVAMGVTIAQQPISTLYVDEDYWIENYTEDGN